MDVTAWHVLGGVRFPVAQCGDEGSETAVVFVHGNPGEMADWEPLHGPVGEFARSVAFDLPGYGRADKPEDFDYTIRGYAAFIDAVLSLLGIAKAHLVAHDFGGPWALRWAADHPEKFASATVINSGVLSGYEWHDLAKIWRTPDAGEAFFASARSDEFAERMHHRSPHLSDDLVREVQSRWSDPGTQRAVLALYRATDESALDEPRETLAALDRPALVIWGEIDVALPVKYAERQRDSFPSAQVVTLPGVGHWPMYEAPDTVRELAIPFLRDQTAQAR
jgi:pimeloyl-ACP methyl ester carboxylesterase